MSTKLIQSLIVVVCASLLAGCAAMIVGGAAATGMAAHDRRSVGTVVDDRVLRVRVSDALYRHEAFDTSSRIKVSAYNGWVLLAGEVRNQERVELASEIVNEVDGVRRLINELAPVERVSARQSTNDKWISGKVNTSLTRIRDLKGFDPTRVKVTTARNIVYLMGLVTPEEAEAAVEQARTVRGVEKVVTAFDDMERKPE